MTALGVRNNNPGNLEASPWSQGLPGYVGTDGRFAQFGTPEAGFNALNSLLTNKFNKGLTTPRQIIGSWAPASDGNNVDAYARFVGSKAGLGPDDKLTPDHLPAVASAIAQYESPGFKSSNTGTPPMGALDTQQVYGPGALQNGGQAPPNPLGSGGVGDTLQGVGAWLQAANNPGGAAALLQQAGARRQAELALQAQYKPQIVDGGTDPFTQQKRLLLVNPLTGKATTINPDGQGGSQGSAAPQGMGAIQDAMRKGVTGEDLLPLVPAEYKPYLEALKNGTAIPGNMGRGGAMRPALMAVAQAIYGPAMDEDNIAARQKAATSMNDPSVNQLGGQIQSANTLMNHNALLSQDIDNLEKLGAIGKVPMWNAIKQGAAKFVPGMIDEPTQAALASFDKHKQAVASELTRLTRGGNGSLQEVQDWKNGLNSADSIAALRSSTAAVVDLMHGRVQAGVDTYNRAMKTNKSVDDYLSAPAQASIGKITGEASQYAPPDAAAPAASPAAPAAAPASGKTAAIPPPAQRQAGKTTFTNPYGKTFTWDGQAWSPNR